MKVIKPSKIAKSLKDAELFRSLESDELDKLENATRWEKWRRGRVICLSDQAPNALVLVKTGRIKLSRLSKTGKEFVLDILVPGDVLGEVGLVDEKPPQALAEAMEDSLVALVPGKVIKQYCKHHPEFFMRLSHLMAARYSRLEDRLLELAFESIGTRFARLLLRLSRDHGVRDSRGTFIPIVLSQTTLGGLLGVSRESVNLTISKLRERGVLSLENRHLIIHQQNLLEELHA